MKCTTIRAKENAASINRAPAYSAFQRIQSSCRTKQKIRHAPDFLDIRFRSETNAARIAG